MPKEIELFEKIIQRSQSLAGSFTKAPNKDLTYRLCCRIWRWKQDYRSEGSAHRVGRKEYQSLLDELNLFESKIVRGTYEKEAREAVGWAREWLQLAIGYRVPEKSNGKCRVF